MSFLCEFSFVEFEAGRRVSYLFAGFTITQWCRSTCWRNKIQWATFSWVLHE